jgi:hypothetical protein
MSAVGPALARAAGYGAAIGLGGELFVEESKGRIFAVSVVASVALRAVAYYFGIGSAIGVFLGLYCGLGNAKSSNVVTLKESVGCALVLGTLGYLGEMGVTGAFDAASKMIASVLH